MDKSRLEALSDGVFVIVMTLIIFNVTLPIIDAKHTEVELLQQLMERWPIFAAYFSSFAVLAMFWISHNFFYSSFTTEVNRKLVLLNMLYLALLAFIPFTTRLLGLYSDLKIAVITYGVNIFLIGLVATFVLQYAIYSDEIDISHVSERLLNQARFRNLLTPTCMLIGIVTALFNIQVALLFYAFPVLFNLTPGSLDIAERVFRIRFE